MTSTDPEAVPVTPDEMTTVYRVIIDGGAARLPTVLGSGRTRDEALTPFTATLRANAGAKVPPYRVLVDLDALATDADALRLALLTDPALAAIVHMASRVSS